VRRQVASSALLWSSHGVPVSRMPLDTSRLCAERPVYAAKYITHADRYGPCNGWDSWCIPVLNGELLSVPSCTDGIIVYERLEPSWSNKRPGLFAAFLILSVSASQVFNASWESADSIHQYKSFWRTLERGTTPVGSIRFWMFWPLGYPPKFRVFMNYGIRLCSERTARSQLVFPVINACLAAVSPLASSSSAVPCEFLPPLRWL
jgi:hypothetical protein